jgi:hypothetical protein
MPNSDMLSKWVEQIWSKQEGMIVTGFDLERRPDHGRDP